MTVSLKARGTIKEIGTITATDPKKQKENNHEKAEGGEKRGGAPHRR